MERECVRASVRACGCGVLCAVLHRTVCLTDAPRRNPIPYVESHGARTPPCHALDPGPQSPLTCCDLLALPPRVFCRTVPAARRPPACAVACTTLLTSAARTHTPTQPTPTHRHTNAHTHICTHTQTHTHVYTHRHPCFFFPVCIYPSMHVTSHGTAFCDSVPASASRQGPRATPFPSIPRHADGAFVSPMPWVCSVVPGACSSLCSACIERMGGGGAGGGRSYGAWRRGRPRRRWMAGIGAQRRRRRFRCRRPLSGPLALLLLLGALAGKSNGG